MVSVVLRCGACVRFWVTKPGVCGWCALYNAVLYGKRILCMVVCGCVFVLFPRVCVSIAMYCVMLNVFKCCCLFVFVRVCVFVEVCGLCWCVNVLKCCMRLCVVCDLMCDVVWRVFNVPLVCVGVCFWVMCWCVVFDVECDGVWVVVFCVIFCACCACVCWFALLWLCALCVIYGVMLHGLSFNVFFVFVCAGVFVCVRVPFVRERLRGDVWRVCCCFLRVCLLGVAS